MSPDKEYMAIVYEYVEEGENDPDTVQQALDFFWLAGFSGTLSQLPQNWKSSVLIDLSDIVPPCTYGWHASCYKPTPARLLLIRGAILWSGGNQGADTEL